MPDDPWSTNACWVTALLFALTAISLAAQQTIGLNRLYSCENGLLKIRHLLGEIDPKYESQPMTFYETGNHGATERRVRIKRSQMWTWQTPISRSSMSLSGILPLIGVVLSNFSILLFIVGLMIAIFVRAATARGDLSEADTRVLFPALCHHFS